MRKWKDDLVPVLLEMMQDSTAAMKREVSYYTVILPDLFTFLTLELLYALIASAFYFVVEFVS